MRIRMRFCDNAGLEERRTRAVSLRRALPTLGGGGRGAAGSGGDRYGAASLWPDLRMSMSFHDLLHSLVALADGDGG